MKSRGDAPRFGSERTGEVERGFIGVISGFEFEDLKIDVFRIITLATFLRDFRTDFGEDTMQMSGQVTLVIVNF